MENKKIALPYEFSIEEHPTGRVFSTKLAGCERALCTPFEESVLAAQAVCKSLEENQSPVLILNANWESLCTFQAFLKAGVQFSVLTLTFKANFDDVEFKWIEALCLENNIAFSTACFDFHSSAHKTELDHIADELKCHNIEIILNIWTACQTDDYPILPGNFMFPITAPLSAGTKWNMPGVVQKKYFDFFEQFEGLPFFLGTTSELAHSFLATKIASECFSLFKNNNDSISFSYEVKRILYEDSGFPKTSEPPSVLAEKFILATRSLRSVEVSRYLAVKNLKYRDEFKFSSYAQKVESFLQPQLIDSLRMQTQALIQNMAGAGVVMPKVADTKTQCVALFPKLMTMQYYEGDQSKIVKILEARDYHSNMQNHSSNQDLHFEPELSELITFFRKSVFEFYKQSGHFIEDVEISLCWANKSILGQSHHKHQHPNSHISGVFYLSTAGGGNIVFHKDVYQPIQPIVEKETLWNSNIFQVKPQAGLLLVFSSDTTHSTLVNISHETRYSISFNAIIRGQVGAIENAAWLNL